MNLRKVQTALIALGKSLVLDGVAIQRISAALVAVGTVSLETLVQILCLTAASIDHDRRRREVWDDGVQHLHPAP